MKPNTKGEVFLELQALDEALGHSQLCPLTSKIWGCNPLLQTGRVQASQVSRARFEIFGQWELCRYMESPFLRSELQDLFFRSAV